MDTDRHTGRPTYDHRSRDWSDVMTSQGIPRIAGNHQKLEEAVKDPSLRAFRETMALILIQNSSSRTMAIHDIW